MKTTVHLFLIALIPVLPQAVPGQGTLYVSNLGKTSTGSGAVGSDAWIAQMFLTGTEPNGYILNSVQLLMNPASGSPSNLSVSVYNNTGSGPGVSLGSLTGPDPAGGGVFTYSTSGITLASRSGYCLVLTSGSPVADGAYQWSATTQLTSSNGWIIVDGHFTSTNGSTWSPLPIRVKTFQVALFGTAVPEPGATALLVLGLALGAFCRSNRRQSTQQNP
jgi:hypothetical protein